MIARPIVFAEDSPKLLYRHLDRWAADRLESSEAWASMVERCDQWVDYSPRNQVLLASYGVVGAVAGVATWERVPSTEPGRGCAPRTGEHGLPVRVPVTAAGTTRSQRSRVAARSGSVVADHRWDLVFAAEQLARRPQLGALRPPQAPELRPGEWAEVVRRAEGRLLGRMPRKIVDPDRHLAMMAAKVPLGLGRPPLGDPVLMGQVVSVVASRVGLDVAPMEAFDPSGLSGRERWQTLVDVRTSAARVLNAVSYGLRVDLAASPLPRVDSSDDREVSPVRRNYLSPADVRGLPLGVWVECGPYSRGEWLARGVAGAVGRAAHLRVNERSYLAVYESRSGAMWRLETTGRGAHQGLVAEGTADDFEDAKVVVREALRERFPDAARSVEPHVSAGVTPQHGWVALPGGRDERTQGRVFDERVSATVSPGPGGRWTSWVTVDGRMTEGPLAPSASAARDVAEAMARGELMVLAAAAPDRADRMVREMADAGALTRADLDRMVGPRLADADRAVLLSPDASAAQLVDLLTSTGAVGPGTIVAVLHHEHVDPEVVAGLIPAIGMPVTDAIRELHERWRMDRLDAGSQLSATPDELKAAGCTTVEMLQAAPREVLRHLDTRERTWELAGHSLLEAGYSPADALRQLALHAPTPETFAAAAVEIEPNPLDAFPTAVRHATITDLVALSERYGLSPSETAETLVIACAAPEVVLGVVHERCDHDEAATIDACATAIDPSLIERVLHRDDLDAEPLVLLPAAASGVSIDDLDAGLRVALGEPVSTSIATEAGVDEALVAALGSTHDGAAVEQERHE
ncbi:MAG: hypothetical protein QM733_04450 [Ilumatobacteraceae bacterium]